MKANELMIDDWVYNKNIAKPMQIYPTIFSQMFRSNPDANTEDYNIFPIPLTAEILEKNGFHKEWDEDIILMVCDTIIVEIGDKYKKYKDGKMYLRRVLAPLYYVHELQHALRLCGIDKTIEL